MRRTHLYIKVNGVWNDVDLYDDIIIPITLKVMDIRSFGSKSAGYSSDISIPHTSKNAQIFGLVEEINAYNATFEMCKNYDAYIEVDGLTTFSGQFRMKKVYKVRCGQYSYYVGCLFSDSKNFIDKLGNQTLTNNEDSSDDLNFSEYDTPASEMTLSDFVSRLQSFDTSGSDWGLTLIDKTNKAAQAFSGGSQQWYTDECTPYLHSMEIFNKIFSKTGYEYTSEFLLGDGSQYLEEKWGNNIANYNVYNLIYPYMKHNSNLIVNNNIYSIVQQLDNTNSRFYAQQSFMQSANWDASTVAGWGLTKTDTSVNLNLPSSSYYSLSEQGVSSTKSAYKFTAPYNGFYHVKVNLPFKVKAKYGEFLQDGQGEWHLSHLVTPNDYSPNDGLRFIMESYLPNMEALKWEFSLVKNGSEIIAQKTKTYNTMSQRFFLEADYNGTYSHTWDTDTLSFEGDILLQAGDTINLKTYTQHRIRRQEGEINPHMISCVLYFTGTGDNIVTHQVYPYPMYIEVQASAETNIIDIQNIPSFGEGQPFYPNSILNPKTTKLEFISNFMKAFNLYIEDVSGKFNYKTGSYYRPNTLRIEPYEVYYNPDVQYGSNVHNWTDKIDWDSVEYRRVDEYLYNIQYFTKVQDKDYYNENYNNTYKLPYGNTEVKGVYCTNNDRNEISLNISSNLCGIVNNSTDTLQCPKIFTLDKNGNVDTKKEYADGMFFVWRNWMSQNTDLGTNYTVKIQNRYNSNYQNITDYYCADTLNKGYGLDDANLNWGGTSAYYQNMKNTIPTYNDLYRCFYEKQYKSLTATDSRIMVAMAYLTAFDIATLQLSDTIIIGDNKWHILELKEWKTEKEPCEVQLIKVLPDESITTNSRINARPIFNDNVTIAELPVSHPVVWSETK